MIEKRNFKIDVLKTFGLLCIILAHINLTNGFIFQLRNFDVILLVFLSGYLSYNSSKNVSYIKYLIKRIKRLVIPTYIFLTIYFSILLFNKYVFNMNFPYSKAQIIDSYKLLEGIGYIWIVRVYLLSALCVPILVKILKKIDIKIILSFLIILLMINEILGFYNIYHVNNFVYYYVSYLITYSIITMFGLISYKYKDKYNKIFAIIFFIIFISIFMYYYYKTGSFVYTQTKKYPPMIYHISYGMFVTYLLFTLNYKNRINDFIKRIIEFISKSSFWIYLWHIYAIYLVNIFVSNLFIRYILIVLLAISITYIQNKIVDLLLKKDNKYLNKFLMFFKG